MHGSIYIYIVIFASVVMCVWLVKKRFCLFVLLGTMPAEVELVISRSGCRAKETNSTDVTSPQGWVLLTENITATVNSKL